MVVKISEESGRGDWIRTSDPLRPRQVRYQAALRPDWLNPLILGQFPDRRAALSTRSAGQRPDACPSSWSDEADGVRDAPISARPTKYTHRHQPGEDQSDRDR